MGSEDSGRQPPFSPIGYRHESVVQEDCSSRNGTERATQVSDPFVPPIQVIQLWKDVANVYETQKQGMFIHLLALNIDFRAND